MPNKLPCNDLSFRILTPDACYFAGLVASDGCVYQGLNRNILSLTMADRDCVEKFQNFLSAEVKLSEFKHKGTSFYRIQVSSKVLLYDLALLGILPKKSLTLRVSPKLSLNRDFWRGVIDGDGGISFGTGSTGIRYPYLYLCSSSKDFILQFSEYIGTLGVKHSVSLRIKPRREPHYMIRLSCMKALKVVQELYTDCGVAMDRKLALAEEVIMYDLQRNKKSNMISLKERK